MFYTPSWTAALMENGLQAKGIIKSMFYAPCSILQLGPLR